jgi:hypothetical protein
MEYQGTKEELGALMVGEAAGTAARFAVGWYFGKFILFPIVLVILVLLGLVFGANGEAIGIVLLVGICVFWVLWAFVSNLSRAFQETDPERILGPAIEKRYPGLSKIFFQIMQDQSRRDAILEDHVISFKRNQQQYLDDLESTMNKPDGLIQIAKTKELKKSHSVAI